MAYKGGVREVRSTGLVAVGKEQLGTAYFDVTVELLNLARSGLVGLNEVD